MGARACGRSVCGIGQIEGRWATTSYLLRVQLAQRKVNLQAGA